VRSIWELEGFFISGARWGDRAAALRAYKNERIHSPGPADAAAGSAVMA
jgi:hypothetical protein